MRLSDEPKLRVRRVRLVQFGDRTAYPVPNVGDEVRRDGNDFEVANGARFEEIGSSIELLDIPPPKVRGAIRYEYRGGEWMALVRGKWQHTRWQDALGDRAEVYAVSPDGLTLPDLAVVPAEQCPNCAHVETECQCGDLRDCW